MQLVKTQELVQFYLFNIKFVHAVQHQNNEKKGEKIHCRTKYKVCCASTSLCTMTQLPGKCLRQSYRQSYISESLWSS